MLPFRPIEEPTGAFAQVVVDYDGFRVIDDFPAVFPEGKAQINILEIEEKAFVHDLSFSPSLSPDQHAGSRSPIHLPDILVVPIYH